MSRMAGIWATHTARASSFLLSPTYASTFTACANSKATAAGVQRATKEKD